MIETINLAHMPKELALYATLYENVKNTSFLRDQLLAGNTDFEYAFIDAGTIVSRKHVLAAAFRALNDYIHDRLKSRNVHSEIVFALSPNNNIGEAFRRFGLAETTKSVLVLKVAASGLTDKNVDKHLSEVVDGVAVPFTDEQIHQMSDVTRIRKIYKLTSSAKKAVSDGNLNATERSALEDQVLGLIALRGAT